VSNLQRELARTGFYRGPIDGAYGPMTASAVVAFHKVWGLERSQSWFASDWDRISGWWPSAPGYGSASHRIEIDLGRQVLFVVRGGRVAAVMPVSSASGEYYASASGSTIRSYTPVGDYSTYRNVNGWDSSYLGELFEPWYFTGGYAIHGSNYVPPWPASHGCVRVSIADSLWLDARMWLGMPVHVRG
jgi:peptidoglycan hydrolase-like protein with peptidoglycan-binding domain